MGVRGIRSYTAIQESFKKEVDIEELFYIGGRDKKSALAGGNGSKNMKEEMYLALSEQD